VNGPALTSLVGGRPREGDEVVPDINPAAPDEHVATVTLAGPGLAAEAVEAAGAAFARWRDTPPPARGDVLQRAADLVDERSETIGRDLTREEGKTLAEAVGETRRAAAILRYYAGQTLEPDGETYPSHSGLTFLYARREPLGVVTAITAWTFPIAIPAWKLAPAIAFGNSAVWKPAEILPLTSTHLAGALVDAGLPDGVLNLVLGRGSVVGDTLVTHDRVDAVTFTGSNAVGRAIELKATEKGKKGAAGARRQESCRRAGRCRSGARGRAGCTRRFPVRGTEVHCDEPSHRRTARAGRIRRSGRGARPVLAGRGPDRGGDEGAAARLEEPLDTVIGYLDVAGRESARVLAGGGRLNGGGSREQGKVARDFFTQWKTVYLDAPVAE
jgi:Aldehyde dehydrogenase family